MTKYILFIAVVTAMKIPLFAQNKADAIIGNWLLPKKDTKIQIYKNGNNYFGKIIWGTGSEAKDIKNPNPNLRNQNVIGLTILNNFSHDGQYTWKNGTIYDPREGKNYSCKIVMNNYNQITVRGFIGISLLGRSEIWTRID